MRHLALLSLLAPLSACVIDNDLSDKDEEQDPFSDGEPVDTAQFDTDTADPPPGEEACNGEDDDGDGQVDEDFADADGNGRVDCLDAECPALDLGEAGVVPTVEACEGGAGTVVADPWDVVVEWQYTAPGDGVLMTPAVGNLTDDNGDGAIDALDTPDIAFGAFGADRLIALHGDGSGVVFQASGFNSNGGVSIGDVDHDGEPDVIASTDVSHIGAVDNTGALVWESIGVGMTSYTQSTVADLEGDGAAEVIMDVGVLDGATGRTLVTLDGVSSSFRAPVVADLDQDGSQEILLGDQVYDATGAWLWENAGVGGSTFSAVLDVDGDVGGEVVFVHRTDLYIHDDDGTLLRTVSVPGRDGGPPCVADFDGDGEPEIAVPASTFLSVWETDGTELWRQPITDSAGRVGCSGFDFDGNGAAEVLLADEDELRIYDGATGTVNYANADHGSMTLWEYPLVADVDNDGAAEIVVASNGGTWNGITVLGHAGAGWARSGTTWSAHDFCGANHPDDGTVPAGADACWLTDNVFRARPTEGTPATPDLVATVLDVCVADCDYGPVSLSVQVANQGGADVEAGTLLSVYADDGGARRLVATVRLPTIPMGQKLAGVEIELAPGDVGTDGFVVVVDDDGNGVGVVAECDEANNEAAYADASCP